MINEELSNNQSIRTLLSNLRDNISTTDHMERLSYGVTTTSQDYDVIYEQLSEINRPVLKESIDEFLRLFKRYNIQKNTDTKIGRLLILVALLIWFEYVFYLAGISSPFWIMLLLFGTVMGIAQGISLLVRHRDGEERIIELLNLLIDNINTD